MRTVRSVTDKSDFNNGLIGILFVPFVSTRGRNNDDWLSEIRYRKTRVLIIVRSDSCGHAGPCYSGDKYNFYKVVGAGAIIECWNVDFDLRSLSFSYDIVDMLRCIVVRSYNTTYQLRVPVIYFLI